MKAVVERDIVTSDPMCRSTSPIALQRSPIVVAWNDGTLASRTAPARASQTPAVHPGITELEDDTNPNPNFL